MAVAGAHRVTDTRDKEQQPQRPFERRRERSKSSLAPRKQVKKKKKLFPSPTPSAAGDRRRCELVTFFETCHSPFCFLFRHVGAPPSRRRLRRARAAAQLALARAERRRCCGFFEFIAKNSAIETLDVGRLALREGEARPQAGDALGKKRRCFFLSCEREGGKERQRELASEREEGS